MLLLAGVVGERIRVLRDFAIRFVDEDQPVMWLIAKDLAHGRFHEPCFYGQSYNLPVEAALAAPWIRSGASPIWMLPVVTSALAILPFLTLAAVAWTKSRRKTASMILLIPLVMSTRYDLVTSMPRGFVTGIAVATPAVALALHGRGRLGWAIAAALGLVSVSVNPNGVPVLAAAGLFAWIVHRRRRDFYAASALGLALAAPVPWFIASFYAAHPNHDWYRNPPLSFSRGLFASGATHLGAFMADFSPLEASGWLPLTVLVLMVVVLARLKQFAASLSLLMGAGVCVFALGLSRVHDANPSVFFSGARMFLAVPVLIAMGASWIDRGLERTGLHERFTWIGFLLAICAGFLLIGAKQQLSSDDVDRIMRGSLWMEVRAVDDCLRLTDSISAAARESDANVVLFPPTRGRLLNYFVPAVTDSAVETLYPSFERRVWRLEEESTRVRDRILIYVEDDPALQRRARERFAGVRVVKDSPRILCLEPAGLTLVQVAKRLGLPVRRF